jgi:hypothetical protein
VEREQALHLVVLRARQPGEVVAVRVEVLLEGGEVAVTDPADDPADAPPHRRQRVRA